MGQCDTVFVKIFYFLFMNLKWASQTKGTNLIVNTYSKTHLKLYKTAFFFAKHGRSSNYLFEGSFSKKTGIFHLFYKLEYFSQDLPDYDYGHLTKLLLNTAPEEDDNDNDDDDNDDDDDDDEYGDEGFMDGGMIDDMNMASSSRESFIITYL